MLSAGALRSAILMAAVAAVSFPVVGADDAESSATVTQIITLPSDQLPHPLIADITTVGLLTVTVFQGGADPMSPSQGGGVATVVITPDGPASSGLNTVAATAASANATITAPFATDGQPSTHPAVASVFTDGKPSISANLTANVSTVVLPTNDSTTVSWLTSSPPATSQDAATTNRSGEEHPEATHTSTSNMAAIETGSLIGR